MSAKKQTTVVQSEAPAPELSGSSLVQTATQISKGEVPTTSQITAAVNEAQRSVHETRIEVPLTGRGQVLAQDTEEVLQAAGQFVAEKNKDDKLQKLVQHAQEVGTAANLEAKKTGAVLTTGGSFSPIGTMAREAQEVVNYFRDLGFFALRSGEFRSVLSDIIDLFQSMMRSTREKAERLSDAARSDYNRSDAGLNATISEGKEVIQQAQSEIQTSRIWDEDQQRMFYERFNNLMDKAGKRPEYRRALNLFYDLINQMRIRAEEIRRSAEKVTSTSSFDKMITDAKDILAEFTGREAIDNLWQRSWDLYYSIYSDDEANRFMNDLKGFIDDSLKNPESLKSDAKREEFNRLLDRGSALLRSEKYNRNFQELFESSRLVLDKIQNDSTTQNFVDKLGTWAQHFALDSEGRPDLFVIQESISELRKMVIPVLSKQLATIPIPRVEGSNDNYHYAIENLTFYVSDFIPEYIQLQTKSDTVVDVHSLETPKNELKVILNIDRFRPHFENVSFWYKRKTFPKMEDHGIADIDLSAGEGTRIKVIWKIKAESDKPFTFSLMKVKCVIDKMDIKIRDAKHDVLDRIATTLFIGQIKQSVAQAVVNNLVNSLQPLNDQMNRWFASRPITTMMENANKQMKEQFDKGAEYLSAEPLQKAMETGRQVIENIGQGISTQASMTAERAKQTYETASETVQTAKDIYQHGLSGKSEEPSLTGKETGFGRETIPLLGSEQPRLYSGEPSRLSEGKSVSSPSFTRKPEGIKHFPEVSAPEASTITDVQQLEESERERRMHESQDPQLQSKIHEVQEELKSVNISPK